MNPINESNFETNPFTKRFVKKCKDGEERISRENGNFKTFKCYKRCKANQMRNMGTMRCRKQKYDYDLYPSSSSFHGSNELKKTRKSRTPTLDHNIYPSQKLRSIKNSIRTKKIELLRNQITLSKGREWFWGEDGKRKKTKSK